MTTNHRGEEIAVLPLLLCHILLAESCDSFVGEWDHATVRVGAGERVLILRNF